MLTRPDKPAAINAADLFQTISHSAPKRIALAVSGGGDSSALMRLFADHWSGTLRRDMRDVLVITVDHGLRSAAANEALVVADWAGEIGMRHVIKRWVAPNGRLATQADARSARYGLIGQAALEFGAAHVLTGHTADDQRETIAMRAKRSRSKRGMAGIAPATLYNRQVWFERPFLVVERHDLRRWLKQGGWPWIDDPSNADTRFERVRTRLADFSSDAHLAETGQYAESRAALARDAAVFLDDGLHVVMEDGAVASATLGLGGATRDAETDALGSALAIGLALVGRREHLPTDDAVRDAFQTVMRSNGNAYTVAGCHVVMRDGRLEITREPRNDGAGIFAMDHLLPVWELPILEVVDRKRRFSPIPRPLALITA
ncbi:MAG: tRNA lysidine(34) synthetase TilS [Pseudomonadota bacterium]